MKSKPMTLLAKTAWAWIPASFLVIILVSGDISSLRAQNPAPGDSRADPAQFRQGTLNRAAVDVVTSFQDFPVLWLGEEFKGYRLFQVARTNTVTPPEVSGIEIRDNRLTLVYGSCVRQAGDWGCTPPLAIIIWAPGTIPGPDGVAEEAKGETGTLRGLPYAIVSESTVLWTGGIAIQIHSNPDIRDDIIKSLRLANGSALGLPSLGPNESLAPLITYPGAPAPSRTPSPSATVADTVSPSATETAESSPTVEPESTQNP